MVARAYLAHCTHGFTPSFLKGLRRNRPFQAAGQSPPQAEAEGGTADDIISHTAAAMLSPPHGRSLFPPAGASVEPMEVETNSAPLRCGDVQGALDVHTPRSGSAGHNGGAMPLCTAPRTQIPRVEAGSWIAGSPSRCQPAASVWAAMGQLLSPTQGGLAGSPVGPRQGVVRAARVLDWDSWDVDEEPPLKKNNQAA
jgi:hypothetical protein